jgi:phospho-2-dehydro-3-deoxyheptonate aldolase
MTRTSDTRITGYDPLLSPSALLDQLPLDDEATAIVEQSRAGVRAVLDGRRPLADHRRAPCRRTTSAAR